MHDIKFEALLSISLLCLWDEKILGTGSGGMSFSTCTQILYLSTMLRWKSIMFKINVLQSSSVDRGTFKAMSSTLYEGSLKIYF